MNNKNLIIIFAGPSGVGKGTVEQLIFADKDLNLQLSVSATTRKPRVGEVDGVHYFFVPTETFEQYIANNELLEYNHHFNNYYGTLYREIDRIISNGGIPFLEIETKGARKIIENEEVNKKYNIVSIFVLPPEMETLKQRIIKRNTEMGQDIEIRLQKAEEEIRESKEFFKYNVVNDVIEHTANEIITIIKNEMGK